MPLPKKLRQKYLARLDELIVQGDSIVSQCSPPTPRQPPAYFGERAPPPPVRRESECHDLANLRN